MNDANLVEVFSSVQGEGPYVGATTLFVRFGECDLRCAWCDSAHTWLPARTCRIETARGSAAFRTLPNPVALDAILEAADLLEVERHRFVSLTGGEPLLQPDAVAAVAERLGGRGPRIYLETHGLASVALERVTARVALDVVSMDWKLVSDVRRAADPKGGAAAPFHDEHERFLRAALAGRVGQVFVKVVVTAATEDGELDEVCARIASIALDTPLVLQPVTPAGSVKERPTAARLLAWTRRCAEQLPDVRLIPQTHPIYDVL